MRGVRGTREVGQRDRHRRDREVDEHARACGIAEIPGSEDGIVLLELDRVQRGREPVGRRPGRELLVRIQREGHSKQGRELRQRTVGSGRLRRGSDHHLEKVAARVLASEEAGERGSATAPLVDRDVRRVVRRAQDAVVRIGTVAVGVDDDEIRAAGDENVRSRKRARRPGDERRDERGGNGRKNARHGASIDRSVRVHNANRLGGWPAHAPLHPAFRRDGGRYSDGHSRLAPLSLSVAPAVSAGGRLMPRTPPSAGTADATAMGIRASPRYRSL